MDKYNEVKDTSEKLLRKIIKFINDSGLKPEDCSHMLYELSASLFTCATISQNGEKEDAERFLENIQWLTRISLNLIYGFYHGETDYIIVGEDEDD